MHYLSKHRFLGQKDSLLGYSNRIKVLGLFLTSADDVADIGVFVSLVADKTTDCL